MSDVKSSEIGGPGGALSAATGPGGEAGDAGDAGATRAAPAPPDRREPQENGLDLRDAFYVLGLITLIVTILTLASQQLAPIALAVLIWFLINAIAQGLKSAPFCAQLPEWLLLTLASVITIGSVVLAGRIVVSNIAELSEGLEGVDQKLIAAVASIEEQVGFRFGGYLTNFVDDFNVQGVVSQVIGLVSSIASNISVVFLFVLFLLLDQPFYNAKLRALFPDGGRRDRVQAVLQRIGRDTRVYVWIMTVVSLGVGVATYAIGAYFGLKGAAFWGFLAFALNFIPTIGTFIGVALPALFALVQFDDPTVTFTLIGALAVVQFVMGNIVLPRVTGDRLNLSEFVVILSLLVWGAMWGVAGMFLAVPLMMVLAIVLAQFDSTRPVAILLSKTGRVGRA